MSEQYPASRSGSVEDLLRVSPEASSAFESYVVHHRDRDARYGSILAEACADNQELTYIMMEAIDGWGLEEGADKEFADGFIHAYKLLKYQAARAKTKLPEITEEIKDDYLNNLSVLFENSRDYYLNRSVALAMENQHLYDSLHAYVERECYGEDYGGFFFELGAVSLYDVMYQQAAKNEAVASYNDGEWDYALVSPPSCN